MIDITGSKLAGLARGVAMFNGIENIEHACSCAHAYGKHSAMTGACTACDCQQYEGTVPNSMENAKLSVKELEALAKECRIEGLDLTDQKEVDFLLRSAKKMGKLENADTQEQRCTTCNHFSKYHGGALGCSGVSQAGDRCGCIVDQLRVNAGPYLCSCGGVLAEVAGKSDYYICDNCGEEGPLEQHEFLNASDYIPHKGIPCALCNRPATKLGTYKIGGGKIALCDEDARKEVDDLTGLVVLREAENVLTNYGAGWDRSTVEAELSKSQEKLAQLSRGLARARDAVKDASRQSDPEAIRDAKDALNSIMSKWDNESRVLEGIQRELASAPRKNAGLITKEGLEKAVKESDPTLKNTRILCAACSKPGHDVNSDYSECTWGDCECPCQFDKELNRPLKNDAGLRRGISKYGSKIEGGK